MQRNRWQLHLILRALAYRRARTLLLVAVLAMASSLATALGIVSLSMEKRVAEEIKKYGANLIIMPEKARIGIGSGGFNFGALSQSIYLEQRRTEDAIVRSGVQVERSLHLSGTLRRGHSDILVEGVNFEEIRRLFHWWQVQGSWPVGAEAVIGSELALRLGVKAGEVLELQGAAGIVRPRISGVVTTGGEEDGLLYLALPELQQVLGRSGQLTMVRLLVTTGGGRLKEALDRLSPLLSGAMVKEVRQVARTSEGLLAKVKLLMALATLVVLVSAGSSVAGTMSASILERSKEIGLMKAMGAGRWNVLLLFCGEAMLLGVMGGLAGYLVGNVIALFIMKTVFAAPPGFLPWLVWVSMGVSLFLALVGSTGPLVSVFKLDPVRTLRGE